MADQIEPLLEQGESEIVEFKETLDNEALETVAAFANTKGGTLLIGVFDDGIVCGIMLGKETIREWANHIAQATHIHPSIRQIDYDDKTIAIIEVPESPLKPVPCRGRYFIRVGKSNRQMSDDDITRAVLEKVGMTWDEVVEPRASLNDLDPDRLRRFRILCNQKGRRLIPPDEDDAVVLEKLNLLREGRLLRAAVLLFGREPQRFYLQAKVKIGRFRSETLIVDDREISGNLFHQVDETMRYFREHLQTRFELRGEPAREVIWEYPLEALREAITNAVCHRDYLDNGQAQVRWYDDNVIFLNPGGLPAPLRVEELKHGHRSVPRNSKIAEMFFYAGLIEQWGSGTLTILRECKAAGLPEPEFEEKQGGLWLALRTNKLSEAYLRKLGLNDRQMAAIQYVKEKGKITNKEYRTLFAMTDRTALRDLNYLCDKGIFEKFGTTGRKTEYILTRRKPDNKPDINPT
jgi:ATP-dependent DNA helicase RecG